MKAWTDEDQKQLDELLARREANVKAATEIEQKLFPLLGVCEGALVLRNADEIIKVLVPHMRASCIEHEGHVRVEKSPPALQIPEGFTRNPGYPPVDGGVGVEAIWSDGERIKNRAGNWPWGLNTAPHIVAYRVVPEMAPISEIPPTPASFEPVKEPSRSDTIERWHRDPKGRGREYWFIYPSGFTSAIYYSEDAREKDIDDWLKAHIEIKTIGDEKPHFVESRVGRDTSIPFPPMRAASLEVVAGHCSASENGHDWRPIQIPTLNGNDDGIRCEHCGFGLRLTEGRPIKLGGRFQRKVEGGGDTPVAFQGFLSGFLRTPKFDTAVALEKFIAMYYAEPD